MKVFTSNVLLIPLLVGLVFGKPMAETLAPVKSTDDLSIEQAFRQAELTLHRYFYSIDSDTDQLSHAILHLVLNNPTLFPFVPHHALDIAMSNLGKKLGQHDVDVFTKPMIMSIDQIFVKKPDQAATFQLTDDVKEQIEDALDKFLDGEEKRSSI